MYCRKWRLKLNYDKCKVIVFSNRKVNKNKINVSIEGHVLPFEDEYKYIGIIFSFNGRFIKALNRLKNQAEKAMYATIRNMRRLHLPIDLQLTNYVVWQWGVGVPKKWYFGKNTFYLKKNYTMFEQKYSECNSIWREWTPSYFIRGEAKNGNILG